MAEFIGKIFVKLFGTHSIIATILISMFPIVEVKGAIPVGMNVEFWGEHALSGGQALLYSLLGSCLIVPIIALIFRPILALLKKSKLFKKIGNFIDKKVNKSKDKIAKNSDGKSVKSVILKCLGVFAFVAVPLPLTGVWTGTCVAVALGLNLWQTVLSVVTGNIVAGLIIMFVCSVFPQITTILFLIVLACLLIIVIYSIIKIILSKDSPDDSNGSDENSEINTK